MTNGAQVWNDELAALAKSWASTCQWWHGMTSNEGTDLPPIGQNMHNCYVRNVTRGIDSWNREKNDYDYESNTCAPRRQCGHYKMVRHRFAS